MLGFASETETWILCFDLQAAFGLAGSLRRNLETNVKISRGGHTREVKSKGPKGTVGLTRFGAPSS